MGETLIEHYAQDRSSPFFLYYALGNLHEPLEVPKQEMDKHSKKLASIGNTQRREFACMTLMMDEAIKNMTSALASNGLYDSTLIVIASDNGANPLVSAS